MEKRVRGRPRIVWTLGQVLVAIVLLHALPAFGQAGEDAALRTAQRQRQQGHAAEALQTLRDQYRRAATPHVAGELGRNLVAASQWLDGEALLAEALGSQDSWVGHNRAALQRAQRTAQEHLCRLELRSNVSDARLVIDERRLGVRALPLEIWVLPGSHSIEAAGGGRSVVEQVRVSAGDRASVMLRLLPPESGAQGGSGAPAAEATRRPGGGNTGLTVLGVSAVVLGVGATATGLGAVILRQGAAHDFNVGCPPIDETRSQSCSNTLQGERTWGVVRWVAFPLAAAFTATAALAFWGAGRGRAERPLSRGACVVDPLSLFITCTTHF